MSSVFLCIVELDVSLSNTNTEIVALDIQKSFTFSVIVPLILNYSCPFQQ